MSITFEPFPHAAIDGWWDDDLLRAVQAEFPEPDHPGWRRYSNGQERKLEGPPNLWGESTCKFIDSIGDRAGELGEMFAIDGLSMETGGAVVLEGSLDGANWGELASFNIGSVGVGPKLTWASDKPVKFIRLNLSTALSGGSSPLLYASVIAI